MDNATILTDMSRDKNRFNRHCRARLGKGTNRNGAQMFKNLVRFRYINIFLKQTITPR
jgi:hypothetical protein